MTARTKRGLPRIPARWKVLGGLAYCPTCKTKHYLLRALSLPVAGPVDISWSSLRPVLQGAWADTTACANWMLTELYSRDVRREPGDTFLRPMPPSYLYPEARRHFANLPTQSVAQLESKVRRVYAAQRYELLWIRTRSLATMRYPAPLLVPRQAWSLARIPGGAWHISMRLADRRVTLRLRGGPPLRRYVRVLEQLMDGRAEAGTLSLGQRRSHRGDRRSDVLPDRRLFVTIPVWHRRTVQENASGTLTVRTGGSCFLVARTDDGDEWRLHGDQIRRALAYSQRLRATLVEDLRTCTAGRAGMKQRLGDLAARRQGRISAWLHEASAHLAAHAAKRRVRTVVYDDRDRQGWPEFPWFDFKMLVRTKLDMRGIGMIDVDEPPAGSGREVAHQYPGEERTESGMVMGRGT